jgi:hypothetical protein
VCPWTVCDDDFTIPSPRTDRNPPAASVEMPQRQNNQSEVRQDAHRDARPSIRTGGPSSEAPRDDQREIQRQDSFHDAGPLSRSDSSSSDEEEPIARPKHIHLSMLSPEHPTYVKRKE